MSNTVVASPTSTSINNNNNNDFNDPDFVNDRNVWWWSPEAYVIKFAILTALFVLFVGYFLGGYIHAKRRIKKGKVPLAYHRWLLPRYERARYDPRYQQPVATYYQVQDGYAMHNYPPPPPAYNANAPIPPAYGQAQGGPKVDPSQQMYAPPEGPPPSSSNAGPALEAQPKPNPLGGILSRFRR